MPPHKKGEAAPEPEAVEPVEDDADSEPETEPLDEAPTVGSLDYNPDGGRVLVDR